MTSSETTPGRGTAVVIGGGLAGVVAAWALRGFAERIVVVERDRYPDEPVFRSGVPQGRHAHLVLEAGHRALEELMPGINQELAAAGAHRVSTSGDLRWLSSAGWMVDYPARMAFLSCTRPVLDKLVLDRVRTEPSIEFLEGTDVVGLLGSGQAVTGVKVRARGSGRGPEDGSESSSGSSSGHGSGRGEVRDIPAELVIDASGRSTSVPKWLTELGCRAVPEERVDAGVAYTSRLFHRPPGVDLGYQAIYLQTKAPDKPRMGVLLPVEGDRWIVSLAGMRGAEPEPGAEGFTKHLSQLRDPALREMLREAEPAGEVRGFLPGPGVRRHYERSAPEGLVVVGDAASTFNPVYGQGVTVSLFCAQVLRRTAARHGGVGHATARDARREVAAVSKTAWMMSSAEDVRFTATTGGPSGALVRLQHRYLDKVLRGATHNPEVTAAFHEVLSLVAPPTRLFHPSVVAAVLRG
ncbi:NAD(P)/FAD-dependent oxidoreductase [Streptomyces sp. CBMA123]|uniref:NAD(P)/FAD-dependent oxidoreductase n=1 Tax=Streptomyces sp. CBMA123 TaxID=1896313 RepID=UPI001CB800DD|nr:FAD-binding monooxygenase [Streptomyces sp. CBMA123]MBD0694788.1 FAD-binding monooxygenase [Streptomyces sp. CBMA123]